MFPRLLERPVHLPQDTLCLDQVVLFPGTQGRAHLNGMPCTLRLLTFFLRRFLFLVRAPACVPLLAGQVLGLELPLLGLTLLLLGLALLLPGNYCPEQGKQRQNQCGADSPPQQPVRPLLSPRQPLCLSQLTLPGSLLLFLTRPLLFPEPAEKHPAVCDQGVDVLAVADVQGGRVAQPPFGLLQFHLVQQSPHAAAEPHPLGGLILQPPPRLLGGASLGQPFLQRRPARD
jgi:hypothetical protein